MTAPFVRAPFVFPPHGAPAVLFAAAASLTCYLTSPPLAESSPAWTQLITTVEGLTPLCVRLTADVAGLNAKPWTPAKDPGGPNLLEPAALQLAPHTIVVVDETSMAAGQLSATGVANLRALKTLADHQTVSYAFGSYELPFNANAPLLILSRGKSISAGDTALQVPVDAAWEQAADQVAVDGPAVDAVRRYLTLAADCGADLSEALVSRAEADFVRARQARAAGAVTPEALHRWCVLARLVAQSNLDAAASEAHWEHMLCLEEAREARLAAAAGTLPLPAAGAGA